MGDPLSSELADLDYCYLTTAGRVSGKPHRIEIWFGHRDGVAYMLNDSGKADWVKNIRANPAVRFEVGDAAWNATARIDLSPDEDALARRLLLDKYTPRYEGDLTEWRETAFPVAIDLH